MLPGATIAQYWYDAEGQRIRKISTAGTEEYVYDKDGLQIGEMEPNGTFNRVEIYAGDRHLVTYDGPSNAAYFIHSDWQGSERVRSNYLGASYETCTNLPFGDLLACVGPDISPLHYTGKMRDTETSLDYFGARYYSSGSQRVGRSFWSEMEGR
jgi:YD repeat-containing protein